MKLKNIKLVPIETHTPDEKYRYYRHVTLEEVMLHTAFGSMTAITSTLRLSPEINLQISAKAPEFDITTHRINVQSHDSIVLYIDNCWQASLAFTSAIASVPITNPKEISHTKFIAFEQCYHELTKHINYWLDRVMFKTPGIKLQPT